MKKLLTKVLVMVLAFGCLVQADFSKAETKQALKNPVWPKDVSLDSAYQSEWSTLTFGRYPQKDATGKTKDPIRWMVLKIDGNKALLMSDKLLDIHQYVQKDKSVDATWEESDVRKWLNTKFMNTAFSEEEKKSIVADEQSNDYVTIPTVEDLKKNEYGFSTDAQYKEYKSRTAEETAFYKSREQEKGVKENSCAWAYMTKTPGSSNNRIAVVRNREVAGIIIATGNVNHKYYGIRPMLTLDLTNESLWKQDEDRRYYVGDRFGFAPNPVPEDYSKKAKVSSVKNVGNYHVKISVPKVKGIYTYEIKYSTNKKMKKSKTIKDILYSEMPYTTKKLKKNKKYYFQVRANYYTNKKSSWSKVISIKTSKKSKVKPKLSRSCGNVNIFEDFRIDFKDNFFKTKWTVLSGKSKISIYSKGNGGISICPKEKGKVTIQAKVGKKKYKHSFNIIEKYIYDGNYKLKSQVDSLKRLIDELISKGAKVSKDINSSDYVWDIEEGEDCQGPSYRTLQEIHWNNKNISGDVSFKELLKKYGFGVNLIDVSDNNITSISYANATYKLNCSSNAITKISTDVYPEKGYERCTLHELVCDNNKLTKLDVNMDELVYISCTNNNIKSLDIPTEHSGYNGIVCDKDVELIGK